MRLIALAAGLLMLTSVYADDNGTVVEFSGMKSTTPKDWKKEEPAHSAIVPRAYQFKLPAAVGDKADAELVLFAMRAAGTVEQNLKRQVGKFNPADGKDKVEEKVEKIKIGTVEATYQDVSGTFIKKAKAMDKDGTPMPNYRQLYVVYETKDGQFFMTLLGPAKTVEKHKKSFEEWLKNFK